MTERARWIDYGRRKVLVHDYSKLNQRNYAETIRQRVLEIQSEGHRDLLLLLDVTDSYVDKEALAAFKQAGRDVRPYVHKLAVIGLSGIQKFLLQLVNQFSNVGARPFDSEQDALNWLIQ